VSVFLYLSACMPLCLSLILKEAKFLYQHHCMLLNMRAKGNQDGAQGNKDLLSSLLDRRVGVTRVGSAAA
jgi:hypothetical protein